MKKVLIIDRVISQYRGEFYNQLKSELKKKGTELLLIYGKGTKKDQQKKDKIDISWGHLVNGKTIWIMGLDLYWQTSFLLLKEADLVIVQQANKLLFNYYLMLFRKIHGVKLAFCGHGKNMQSPEYSLANQIKKKLLTQVDWWFPYTEGVKRYLIKNKFNKDRISVIENAIDTRALLSQYQAISNAQTDSIKEELGIQSENIGLYCGGIYKEKRIDFLIQACDRIKSFIPDFHFILIGAGNESEKVVVAQKKRNWMHYLGPKFNEEKVPYFKLASVFLMPGLVGLAILDTFAMETPLITTQYPYHSPEIEYLAPGQNGVMTKNNINSFAEGVVKVLKNPEKLQHLKKGCQSSALLYTNEKMVKNFSEGIVKCLG
ncbi:glycosyltransferase family 4 protein [Xanthovirga aplysinae]|uniref:glycosyltransferase family 4 protein n=1 Tax=Xanthovirga aplysinae TaxID=2529853 RepID=UPI0012BCAAC6|nr:glycosyltransferase family 4 protein [Xanthovirga aplysinae]MTI30626.1 glycosyltransferase [Xanthovirga aplysinae]